MFFHVILLVFSLMSFQRGFHVSSCDYNCADNPVFTPSRLVVKYGDRTSANCSVCQRACLGKFFKLENPVGVATKIGTTILWKIDRMTEWDTSAICFYNDDTGRQCCSTLPVTVYLPPDNVSISIVSHTGPMVEGQQFTLQCTVQDVAPVGNLTVTFYRGQTALARLQSNSTKKKPVTEIFTLSITASKEDDGVQYWCEAELELGPDGPEHPPVVMSQNIITTVYYKPQLKSSSQLDTISITEGNPLTLSCSAVGNPSPSYTWTLPSNTPSTLNRSVLTISSVTPAHEGRYTCFVSNFVGTTTAQFHVDVKGLESTSATRPPTATKPTAAPNGSTSSTLIRRFILCLMLLFSALV